MKNILAGLMVSIIVASLLVVLSQTEIIPLNRIIPVRRIPDITGIPIESAEAICRIKDMLLKVMSEEHSQKYEKGIVISQMPRGSLISKESEIFVVLSKGKLAVQIPDLKGLSVDVAEEILRSLSLYMGDIEYAFSDKEKDMIISFNPESGINVEPDSRVNVIVSKGQDLIYVPKLVGKSLTSAQKMLADNELILGQVKKVIDIERKFGIIIKQYPPFGRKVTRGSAVTVVVNEEE